MCPCSYSYSRVLFRLHISTSVLTYSSNVRLGQPILVRTRGCIQMPLRHCALCTEHKVYLTSNNSSIQPNVGLLANSITSKVMIFMF